MVTFNKVLSGSVVHVPEQTHTNNVISIIFGINTLYIHVIYIYGQMRCPWEVKMPTKGYLSMESLACASPTFLK